MGLASLLFATVTVFADVYITQPILPLLSREFGVQAPTAALTISVVVLMIAGFFGLRWSSSGKGNILFPAAIKRGRASDNQFSVVKSNGRLVDDPGGYLAADGR